MKTNLLRILTDTTREEWIQMNHDFFIKHIVENLNMMRNNQLKTTINQLTFPQFEMITSKCWDEQDQQPNEPGEPGESGESDESDETFREAYDKTLPIVILLENILSIRIESEIEYSRKEKIAKQLALINIILQPHLFDDVADKINRKRRDK